MVVVVAASVVVGAAVVVGGTVVGAIDVDAGAVVVVSIVVVVAGSDIDVVEPPTDVDEVDLATVTLGSSTKGSIGTGRPAIATPTRPPTTITARPNGHDLRMRSVKLAARSPRSPRRA